NFFGPVEFDSDGPINISNNTTNSLGPVYLYADTDSSVPVNNSNITYTEGTGVNLQGLDTPETYSGTVSITSVNGGILATSSSDLYLPVSAKLNLTAQSANGYVNFPSNTDETDIN